MDWTWDWKLELTPCTCCLSSLRQAENRNVQIIQTGSAQTDTGYYSNWKDLRPLVNKPATSAFWNDGGLKFHEKRNVMSHEVLH